jgi:hypothetical protein
MKFHDKEELELMKSIETEAWVSVKILKKGCRIKPWFQASFINI